jgi:hypothetical protein
MSPRSRQVSTQAAISASAAPVPRASPVTNRSFMTAMRAARNVDQVQKIVANPMAAPASSRAISCTPSRSGSASSARLSSSTAASGGSTS